MENQKRKLVLASFSQTIADTTTKTLYKENMETIKLQAIQKMFGDIGVMLFLEMNKKNPSLPIQVSIVRLLADQKCYSEVFEYMQNEHLSLLKKDPTPIIFKEFINLNVVMLYDMIGSPTSKDELWPHIYPGFTEFRSLLAKKGIDFGIVSSGYEGFIIDVFDFYQIPKPLFCVTPEDNFELVSFNDWTSKNKPSRLLISQAINYWTKYNPSLSIEYALANTIMIGNDLYLDGKMAENAGIPFWYFTSDINNVVLSDNQRSFSNWGQMVNALKNDQLF